MTSNRPGHTSNCGGSSYVVAEAAGPLMVAEYVSVNDGCGAGHAQTGIGEEQLAVKTLAATAATRLARRTANTLSV